MQPSTRGLNRPATVCLAPVSPFEAVPLGAPRGLIDEIEGLNGNFARLKGFDSPFIVGHPNLPSQSLKYPLLELCQILYSSVLWRITS